jgi:hypothetical protein
VNIQRKLFGMLIIVLLATPVFALSASAESAQYTGAYVETHPSQGPVTRVGGGRASVIANDAGIDVSIQTSQLVARSAHTLWIVVINKPELCLTSPCTPTDILFRTETVDANVVYGSGHVVGRSGKATFSAHLPIGEVAGGWYDNPFTNPRGAEVHLVINDHGPVIPRMVSEMISTYRAGCTDASLPGAFPATAKADGTPGPNQCRLVQAAILQQ